MRITTTFPTCGRHRVVAVVIMHCRRRRQLNVLCCRCRDNRLRGNRLWSSGCLLSWQWQRVNRRWTARTALHIANSHHCDFYFHFLHSFCFSSSFTSSFSREFHYSFQYFVALVSVNEFDISLFLAIFVFVNETRTACLHSSVPRHCLI